MKKRRWKKIIALSLLFTFLGFNHIPAEPLPQDNPDESQKENEIEIEIEEPKNLYALSACLMDADSGRILFGKEEDVHRANASTTKIMTLIITLEHADLNEVVTFSDYAASQPDVQLNGASGEQFLLKDLCFSLMLESHNDSAVAIAEHVAGSVEAFAGLMNEKAAELGCKPMLKIEGFAVAGFSPALMGYTPKFSSEKLAKKLGLDLKAIDMVEINGAFASQAYAVQRDLGLDPAKVNIYGGGISIGHPLGATGVILTIKVMYELARTDKKDAMISMCIGGGQGASMYFTKC